MTPPYEKIRQSIHDPNPSDIHSQINAQPIQTYRPVSPKSSITHPATNFEQAKQIIMDIDALSFSPTLQNKILQELKLHGLCKYNNTQQAYLYENSNEIVNCSYILVFLKQLKCYIITPDTHHWYKINANEITDNHKIALSNDLT